MKRLQTVELGPFPLPAAVSLVALIPCAAALHLLGTITSLATAIAALSVSALGVYSLTSLIAWAGMFLAEKAISAVASAATRSVEGVTAAPAEPATV